MVNARDVKNVPGRPQTELDAVWLCKLAERGIGPHGLDIPWRTFLFSGGNRARDRSAELTAVTAGLLFGFLAQLAGEIGELV